jgi:glycerophosphoryl diester phosphodiesterase
MRENFEVIIHRAHNTDCGENTIAGIHEIRAIDEEFRIELDISVTQDRVPVLFHDLSFGRLCGVEGFLAHTNYVDLPKRLDGEEIPQLKEVINLFPSQKFLFDLRTENHEAYFSGSIGSQATPQTEPLKLLREGLETLLQSNMANNIRLVTSNEKHRLAVQGGLRDFTVDAAEIGTRDAWDAAVSTGNTSQLEGRADRIYVRSRKINQEIVNKCQDRGIKVIATAPPSLRSIETSLEVLDNCLEFGLDGIVTSPIDHQFVTRLKQ